MRLQNVVDRAVIGARFGSLRFDLLAGKGPMAADIENPETPSHETLEVIREEEMKRRERGEIITALKQSSNTQLSQ